MRSIPDFLAARTCCTPPICSTPINPRLLRRWEDFAQAMLDQSFELDVESFAGIASTYTALKRAGASFDPTIDSLMHVLNRQLADATMIEGGDLVHEGRFR